MTRLMIPPSNEPEIANKILEIFADTCQELDMTFFLYAGTALGFVRDKDYIEKDNDIDVGVLCDSEGFKRLEAALVQRGFVVDPTSFGAVHSWKDNMLVDIRASYGWEADPPTRRCVIPYAESFDTVVFRDRTYNIPHPFEEHFACLYGPNWRVPRPKIPIVVFTTVCGDLFHIGHLRFLQGAAKLGHILVVGVVTDEFRRSYQEEPIIPYEQRCEVIQALRCVDRIVPYESFRDCGFAGEFRVDIRVIRPEYGCYEGEAEARIELEARGIKHIELSRTPNISTTQIKKRCWEEVETGWELIEITEEHDEEADC